ncbi:hypothetical protein [Flavobacterium sp. XGLA_31]|uniref:hypothetical protein n=1 Tax=Flavobacterium sp. XGLA_31 TaxID=3447666 RepID=UPI003F3A34F5
MKNIMLFLLVFTVLGCGKKRSSADSFSTSKIVNSTERELIVAIQYDRVAIEKIYGKNSYQMGTLSMENYPQLSFDRKNLISKVSLKPKDSLMIEYVNSEKPKFEIVKMITVYGAPKTLILKNRKEMSQKFIEKGNKLFLLEIK